MQRANLLVSSSRSLTLSGDFAAEAAAGQPPRRSACSARAVGRMNGGSSTAAAAEVPI